jgi:simple sugar transport system permease protein
VNVNALAGILESASPLILASLGALLTELSGALGIFVEGLMNCGAFFAWVIAGKTGSVFLGTSLSACAAALLGALFARLVRTSGANPFVAGLALNIASGSLASALSARWFGTAGVLRNAGLVSAGRLPWILLALAALAAVTLYVQHTPWGLRLRAAGMDPGAARERGIRPGRYWEGSWAACAAFAVLAGAALTFRVGSYIPGGAGGRGWISLAAVFLGARRPLGTAAAAVVFALAGRAAVRAQASTIIPPTILLGLPHALALALYALSRIAPPGRRAALQSKSFDQNGKP